MRKKDKKIISTIGSKASQALDEVFELRREKREIFTQIMYAGGLIFLGAFLYDFVAEVCNHRYSEGWGADQIIVMGIEVVVALWGLWRR